MSHIDLLERQARLGYMTPPSTADSGWQSADLAASDDATPAAADAIGDPHQQLRVMQEFAISYDGRNYHYHGYSYDALADAVGYAKLLRSQPAHE